MGSNERDDMVPLEPTEYRGADDDAVDTRLDLDESDERLPWLETADDDLVEEGSGTGRLLAFMLGGLLLLAGLIYAVYALTGRESDPALVADGSTIPAPATPYKEAPKDAGGKKEAGTGDTSFAVSEGQTRPARLDQRDPSAATAPSASPAPKPAVDVEPKAAAPTTPAATGGVGVQVGAYSTRALAEAAWTKLSAQQPALAGVGHRAVQGSADIGTVWRLQAVAKDTAAANALCARLKAGGLACQVK